MGSEKGSALIFVLVTFAVCIMFMIPISSAILSYTSQKYTLLDDEQAYLTAVDSANLFADEICDQTEVGEKMLSTLRSGSSLNFTNLTFENCDRCDVGIRMPYTNKIVISSSTTKNKSKFALQLNLELNETAVPNVWEVKNYVKSEVSE